MAKASNYEMEIPDPLFSDERKWKIIIPHDIYLQTYKYDVTQYWNLVTAREVLLHPLSVFHGIRESTQDEYEKGWCYCGRTETWYVKPEIKAPFPDHLIFLVFINPRRILYEWRADKCDRKNNTYPIDHRERFEEMIWPTHISFQNT